MNLNDQKQNAGETQSKIYKINGFLFHSFFILKQIKTKTDNKFLVFIIIDITLS